MPTPRGHHRGATYHPVCVWLAFGMCIPSTLWVVKVGLKAGLEWPSHATGPSLLGSLGPGPGQVKTQTNNQVSLSVLCCGAKSTPTICPTNKTPPPATTIVKSSLFRLMTKQSTLQHYHPPWHHPLELVWCHSLQSAPPLKAQRAVLLALAIAPGLMLPTCPPPPSGCLWAGHLTPAPRWTPDLARARSTCLPHPSSTAALVVTTARAA